MPAVASWSSVIVLPTVSAMAWSWVPERTTETAGSRRDPSSSTPGLVRAARRGLLVRNRSHHDEPMIGYLRGMRRSANTTEWRGGPLHDKSGLAGESAKKDRPV